MALWGHVGFRGMPRGISGRSEVNQSSWGHGVVSEEVKGHVWSLGSLGIIYERDRLKNIRCTGMVVSRGHIRGCLNNINVSEIRGRIYVFDM